MKISQCLLFITAFYFLAACQSVEKNAVVPLTEEESHARIKSLSSINNMVDAFDKKDMKAFYAYIDTPNLFKSIHQQLNIALLDNNPNMKMNSFDYKFLSNMNKNFAKDHLEPKRLFSYLSGSYKELDKVSPFYSFHVGHPNKGREYIFIKAQDIEAVKLTFEPNIDNDWKLVDINIRAADEYED